MRRIFLHYRSHQKDPIDLSLMGDTYIVLGREVGVDVHLNEKKISRKHCQLLLSEDQTELLLEDLGSLNGTTINGVALKGRKALQSGDRFQLGPFEFEIEVELPLVDAFDQPTLTQDEEEGGDLAEDSEAVRHFNAAEAFSPLSEVSMQIIPEDVDFKDYDSAENAFSSLSKHGVAIDSVGGPIISGRIEELSLSDVLQMLSTTQKSGKLVISEKKILSSPKTASKDTAILHLDKGHLKFAEYGRLIKEEAFFETLTIESGYFALFPPQKEPFVEVIELPIESLLIQGLSYLDEKKANKDRLKESDRLQPAPDEPLSQLDAQELTLFQLAWKHQEVGKILKVCPMEKTLALDILQKLHRNGFLKKL
jgi:pSer/pThr/pTyr-binding forkhead associated (FHA) protein